MKKLLISLSSKLAVPLLAAALACFPALATGNVFDMADQFDHVDKQDFQEIIDKANACIRVRDFSCGDAQLNKAAKLANSSQDKLALNAATQNLKAERQKVAEEEAERKQQIRLAEERRREEEDRAERRRQRERDEEESSRSRPKRDVYAELLKDLNGRMANLAAQDRHTQQLISRAYQEKQDQIRNEQARQDREAAERQERQRAAYDRRAQEQRAAEDQRAQNERAAREQRARDEYAAAERRAQEAERQRQAQINRNQAPAYNPTVLAQNTGGGAGNSAGSSRKTGESAQNCVRASVSGETLTFKNRCGEQVFVIWCGDLKYSKKKCGDDGRFYNMSDNIKADGEKTTQITGQYQYAACKGDISFGNDGNYRETSNGGVECLKR